MKRKYIFATYIPNGVNLDIFKPLSNNKEFIIGICQNYNLEKIKKICKKVKIKLKKVLNFPYEKMPYFYSLLKIFISIPPRSTGFNMVWLEAMACEVPYIIGTNAGIGEILPIYKVSNFKELEKLLMEIKKGEIKPLKNQRKWIIKNKLTWKEHVNKLLIIYQNLQ